MSFAVAARPAPAAIRLDLVEPLGQDTGELADLELRAALMHECARARALVEWSRALILQSQTLRTAINELFAGVPTRAASR